MASVNFKHIYKRFPGGVTAVNDFNLDIQDKEFVDWFMNFDFDKAKRQGLMRYYRKNFFSILKRKLHI